MPAEPPTDHLWGKALVAVQMEMRREAQHLVEEFKSKRKHALLNLLSDSVAGTAFFVTLAAAREARWISSSAAATTCSPVARPASGCAFCAPVPCA